MINLDPASLTALTLLVGIAAWFSFKARVHFASDSPRTATMFILEGLSLLLVLVTLVEVLTGGAPSLGHSAAAIILGLLAGALFASALRATRKRNFGVVFGRTVPPSVIENGPYKYIRHPLYTAYLLNWSGCVVLSQSLYALTALIVITIMYFVAARSEERDLLRSPVGQVYADYRARTGLLLPRLKSRARNLL